MKHERCRRKAQHTDVVEGESVATALNGFRLKARNLTMPFEVSKAKSGTVLLLTGRLGVRQARQLWDAIQPALASRKKIELRTDELEEMDSSIIKILYRVAHEGSLKIGSTSDGFMASLRCRGLEEILVQTSGASASELEARAPQTPAKTKARSKRSQHV